MRLTSLILPVALSAVCAPALAQSGLPPVEPETIAAAARSCADSLSDAGVDEKRLANEGWQRASLSARGKAVDSALRIYARSNVVLLLTPDAIAYLISIGVPIPATASSMSSRHGFPSTIPARDDACVLSR